MLENRKIKRSTLHSPPKGLKPLEIDPITGKVIRPKLSDPEAERLRAKQMEQR